MFDAVRDLVRVNYKLQLETKELSVKGWNWGKTEFQGNFVKYLNWFNKLFRNLSKCILILTKDHNFFSTLVIKRHLRFLYHKLQTVILLIGMKSMLNSCNQINQ